MTYSVRTGAAAARRASLWSGGFGWLLGGQTISTLGSQVTFVALPLIAAATLHASPGAMGVLAAVDNLPYLLIGLFVGVWVDRLRRRPLLIAADAVRALAVASVPVAWLLEQLTFAHLCLAAFIVGVGNIVFDVACQAHLPEMVPAEKVVDANGALQTSAGVGGIAAQGLAGLLIKAFGAPLAILVDAASYLVSILTLWAMPGDERLRTRAEGSSWSQVVEGLRAVRRGPRLAGLAGASATVSFAMNVVMAVLIYEISTVRHQSALVVGLAFLTFGLGGAIGAGVGTLVGKALGAGRTLAAAPLIGAAGLAVVAASGGAGVASAPLLFSGLALAGLGLMAQQVLAAGLRQTLAPEASRGRVIGTLRFLEWGVMPLGALLGGALGQLAGTTPTLWVGALLVAAAGVPVLVTPLVRTTLPTTSQVVSTPEESR